MAISGRTFGVELECGHPSKAYTEVMLDLIREGFPAGYSPSATQYGVGRDGSGIEVSSRILKGEKGYRELTQVMDYLHDLGCYVTRRDGMHVHVGASEFADDEKATRVLARTWYNNQGIIARMCSSHRYLNHHCKPISEKIAADVGKTSKTFRPWYAGQAIPKFWGGSRYFSINFEGVESRGTVEFRLHEGCLDPVKAIAWIKFCQALVDHSYSERKVLTCASKTELLTALRVPEDAASKLWPRQKQIPPAAKIRRGVRS